MHANSESLLGAATNIMTDQLGNNVGVAPIIYNRPAGTFSVANSMTDTATVYCCRPQEYIEY